jgi:hypothetical protein
VRRTKNGNGPLRRAVVPVACILTLLCHPVRSAPPDAEPAPSAQAPAGGYAHPIPAELYLLQQQKFKEELERRDAIIADLTRRVEQLEHARTAAENDRAVAGASKSASPVVDSPPAAPAASPPQSPGSNAAAEAKPTQSERSTPAPAARDQPGVDLVRHVAHLLTAAELDKAVGGAREFAPLAAGLPTVSPPEESSVAEAKPAQPNQSTPPAAPGQFQVDEAAVDRALEQSLVARGALLNPFGTAQVEPTFSYTRREVNNVAVVQNGAAVGANVRRDEFEGDLALRFGLPFDSQLDVDFPYNIVHQQVNTANGSNNDTGSGFGDIEVGFSKTLLRQEKWWPDLIGRVFWNSDTGASSDNNVPLNAGFNQVGGSLTALARKDPLAFVGSASYEAAFEKNNDRPGNDLAFSIGAFLAASPETTLRLVLNQQFIDDAKVNGQSIEGSNQVQSAFTIGGAVSVAPGVLVDISADIGLTNEAPDYVARISVPIQFNLPVK